ncbi:MAG TPA: 50S ribosomal protein L11 [Candidatus Paceibacterota bacterium]|jgi:large subunit ribosomal protein L11|nr:50S ribosomal protein L11 [Parcubacteria group bacterium]MDP6119599.1 50S ribosomal protein L11 [Candidatus Paceibacterota bacterium]HJN62844.1 50S ribosomal protein L11 [Candidatus Paceibacterota bacterium]|tara:strand:+ start:4208 stop:4630 length:423 start_codon:yes stop_codon:yes gene_type:complete
MAKQVVKKVKTIVQGGAATPAPPLGPTLGQAGINIGEFITRFNEATQDKRGELVPVVISVYEDRSFDFITKTPPTSSLLIKAAGIKKGSGKNTVSKAGSVTKAQVKEIAEKKMVDLNAKDIEGARRIIEGSARSMGIETK